MKHDDIENEDIVRRYSIGQLPAEEAARFEAHYLECADCQQELETFQAMRHGLTVIAAESVASRRIAPRPASRPLHYAMAAIIAGLAVVPAWLLLNDQGATPAVVGNLQVLPVTQLRSTAENPQAAIRPEPGKPFILMIELDWPDQPAYDVSITDAAGNPVWQGDGLRPNYLDSLTVSIPAGFLEPGVYRAEVRAADRSIGAFPFEILPAE